MEWQLIGAKKKIGGLKRNMIWFALLLEPGRDGAGEKGVENSHLFWKSEAKSFMGWHFKQLDYWLACF